MLPSGPDQDRHLKGNEGGGEEEKTAAVGVVRKGLLEMMLEQNLRVGGPRRKGEAGQPGTSEGRQGGPAAGGERADTGCGEHGWRGGDSSRSW